MKGSIDGFGPLGSLRFRLWTLLSCAPSAIACSANGAAHAVSARAPSQQAAEAVPAAPSLQAAEGAAPAGARPEAVQEEEAASAQAAETTGHEKAASGGPPTSGHRDWNFAVVNKWHLCEIDDLDDCTRQCRRGHLSSCVRLGNMYAAGTRVRKDLAAAAELYELPCGFHIAVACSNRASIFAHDDDMAHAAEYYTRGCDGGDAHGCYRLGVLYEGGSGVPADTARAATVYQRACDGGELPACSNLGRLYAVGIGVEHDAGRAVVLFRKACDGGNAGGCGNLGSAYQVGEGVARDRNRADELHKRACDGGAADFCASVLTRGARGKGAFSLNSFPSKTR